MQYPMIYCDVVYDAFKDSVVDSAHKILGEVGGDLNL